MAESAVTAAPTESLADARRVSPAAHLAEQFAAAEVTGARAVRIREVAFLTMVGVRVGPGSAATARIETRLGGPAARRCGAVTTGDGVSVLWLSPDEFLVVTDEQPARADRRGWSKRSGMSRARWSTSRPTAPRSSWPDRRRGRCWRRAARWTCTRAPSRPAPPYLTLIGSVPVVLWKTADEPYRILPRSSFADFLGRWLLDAMAEFKAPELP